MKAPTKQSRNAQRKTAYAAQAQVRRTKSEKRARAKRRRAVRLVGSRDQHQRPCGNHACRPCYAAWITYAGAVYIAAADLAAMRGVSRQAVANAITRGTLPCVRALGRVLVPAAEARVWAGVEV